MGLWSQGLVGLRGGGPGGVEILRAYGTVAPWAYGVLLGGQQLAFLLVNHGVEEPSMS
jgi:hypothetical protein